MPESKLLLDLNENFSNQKPEIKKQVDKWKIKKK